ncbi:MAG: hypothetical protein WDZ74_00050 [Candidatus Paceibacterota bacterium]
MEEENTEENFAERRNSERRRSIRDVKLSEELLSHKAQFQRPQMHTESKEGRPHHHRRGTRYAGYVIGIFLITVLIFGGFLATSYFSSATVTIVPRTESVVVNEELVVSGDQGGGLPLAYEVFSVDEEVSQSLEGESEEEVERSAMGRIVIYNAHSEENQALITNTRFKSANGNIYRIGSSVVVPGIRNDGSPGSLEVTVTSDGVGEKYNLTSGRLTIPGLEGTDLYDGMYAEVKEPLTGGFVGVVQTVDADDEEEAREQNRVELETLLNARITEVLPPEYLFVPGSIVVEFTELPNTSEDDAVEVTTRGTLYGVMFKQDLLASYIANNYLDGYNNQPLLFSDPSSLTFSFEDESIELSDIQDELEMTIEGNVELAWVVETARVKEVLAGTKRGEFQTNVSAIPGVHSARLELVPGFARSIPSNPDKIQVLLETEL